jgi:integrase
MAHYRKDSLVKRCACARKRWSGCRHPYYFVEMRAGKRIKQSLRVSTPEAARAERDKLRGELLSETLTGQSRMTVSAALDEYLRVEAPFARGRAKRRPRSHANVKMHCEHIRAVLGPLKLAKVTIADVERLRAARRALYVQAAETLARAERLEAHDARALRRSVTARGGVSNGEVGLNRLLRRLRHVFSWAVRSGKIKTSPFSVNGKAVIEFNSSAEYGRERRLRPGEEERLLAAASPFVRALVLMALDTGCRVGELLSLQWRDVERESETPRRLILSPEKTKTSRPRVVPLTRRAAGIVAARPTTDPAGEPLGPEGHVFGNELGEPVRSIRT